VALKIFPAPLLLLLPFFTVYRLAMQVLSLFGYLSKKGNNKGERLPILRLSAAIFKAHFLVLFSLRGVLEKRKILRQNKRIPDSDIYSWFKKYGLKVNDLFLD
jgi:hypothetical protein